MTEDEKPSTFADRFSDPEYTKAPPKEEVRELNPEELKQAQFQEFLRDTKEKFDKYFSHLGYICFIFNKLTHHNQSAYITNSSDDVLPIVEPYANAPNVQAAKGKKDNLKKLRRLK